VAKVETIHKSSLHAGPTTLLTESYPAIGARQLASPSQSTYLQDPLNSSWVSCLRISNNISHSPLSETPFIRTGTHNCEVLHPIVDWYSNNDEHNAGIQIINKTRNSCTALVMSLIRWTINSTTKELPHSHPIQPLTYLRHGNVTIHTWLLVPHTSDKAGGECNLDSLLRVAVEQQTVKYP